MKDTLSHDSPAVGHYPERVVAEAIARMFQSLRGVIPLMPLLPLMLVLGMWAHAHRPLLIAWLVFAVSVPLARYVIIRRFFALRPDAAFAPRWANGIAATALLDGLIWGAAGILFFVADSVPHQVLLLTMIVGIAAGSVFVTSYWPATQYAYAIPAVGLAALGLALHGSPASLGMAAAMVVYLVILHQIVQQAYSTTMDAIALRFENVELVEQLRAQKEEAERANVSKSKFLAAASHDLRQPLHALALFTTALNERIRYPEVKGIAENINRCVLALDGLFQSLLDVSKLDAGIIEPRPVHFALRPLMERLSAEYAPQARAKGLGFSCEGGEVAVHSDPALVECILRNLLSNAIRYSSSGGIALRAQTWGDVIQIAVHDSGAGIPEDKREDVFREFVQLENPERDRSKGLGLGLAIVRRLVALLGATIELDSVPGRGSMFRFSLPRGSEAAVVAPAFGNTDPPGVGLGDMVVAVIDDEADIRDGMRTLLEGWGCRVVAAEDAAAATEQLRAEHQAPDIVIADYRLREGATGAQAINEIQSGFGVAIPGLIITGDTAPERLVEARVSGHLLLHKPVQPAKLRAILQKLRRSIARRAAS